MLGIYTSSIIATLISTGIIGAIIFFQGKTRLAVYLLTLIALPISPVVNIYIKAPVTQWVTMALEVQSLPTASMGFKVILLFIAPVTEELSKISFLFIPKIKSYIGDRQQAVVLGLALGLGFGVGEIWYLASIIADKDPLTAMLPYLFLGDFIIERCISVFAHGVFSAIAVTGFLSNSNRLAVFIGGAIALHALSNSPVLLYQAEQLSLKQTEIALYITFCVLWLILIFLLRLARNDHAAHLSTKLNDL